ncbi:MAG: hypothetical protein J5495_03565, partial [Bacteroidales bacterium]|nr:hypothetical protein [Bacteroidales bacterium]
FLVFIVVPSTLDRRLTSNLAAKIEKKYDKVSVYAYWQIICVRWTAELKTKSIIYYGKGREKTG